MKLFYLVHDLGDEAVKRRVRFLRDGGAAVSVVGFRRQLANDLRIASDWVEIGRTRNGKMLQRVAASARAVSSCQAWGQDLRRADVIVARNLEMLAVAASARARLKSKAPIVYECLDIHRLMTRRDVVGASLRRVEGGLLRASALLVVSSPRFVESYFQPTHRDLPRWIVLENKLLAAECPVMNARGHLTPAGPPWRIGWFGIIRCRKSLLILAELARVYQGRVEVEIRGRPALDAIPDFDAVVTRTPGMSFCGPYDRSTDLAEMYRRVHFNWTVDFYDEGENSSWLLPNRLYEGTALGTVPLALRDVEAGRWLERHGCGVLFDAQIEPALHTFFTGLTETGYHRLQQEVAELASETLIETREAAREFVAVLSRLTGTDGPAVKPILQGKAA